MEKEISHAERLRQISMAKQEEMKRELSLYKYLREPSVAKLEGGPLTHDHWQDGAYYFEARMIECAKRGETSMTIDPPGPFTLKEIRDNYSTYLKSIEEWAVKRGFTVKTNVFQNGTPILIISW